MDREGHRMSQREILIGERAHFVGLQSVAMKNQLLRLHLPDIKISSIPEYRDVNDFAGRPTMSMSCLADDSLALFVALGQHREDTKRQQFMPLLVSPTKNGSGFLVDDVNGIVKTDSFWICEDGELKYIIPSEPLTIDVINSDFDFERNDPVISTLLEPQKRVLKISNDKLRTKKALRDGDVAVPRDVIIELDDTPEDITRKIDTLVAALPNDRDLVLKELYENHGIGVGMFPSDERENLEGIIEGFVEDRTQVYVEERIIPLPLTSSQKEKFGFEDEDDIDWNARILVDLDLTDPKAFDGEIRANIRDYGSLGGVNLTHRERPARAKRLDILENDDLVERMYTVAEAATRAVCRAALSEGERIAGIAGVDIIVANDGRIIPVLEVTTDRVGGIGTLTKIDGKPLENVSTKLYAKWAELAEERYRARQNPERSTVRRVEHNAFDKLVSYEAYRAEGRYRDAERIILELGHNYSNQRWMIYTLYTLGELMGDFTGFSRYFGEAEELGYGTREIGFMDFYRELLNGTTWETRVNLDKLKKGKYY